MLLPDQPPPGRRRRQRGRRKPTHASDGSGIYYLDVLVHRASLPESWIARFEDSSTVLPARPSCRRAAPARISTASTTSRSPTRARSPAVVALRALGRKVKVERTGVTFDGVESTSPAYRAGLRPGMVITAIDGVRVPQLADSARRS